jgi:hypothetical protein
MSRVRRVIIRAAIGAAIGGGIAGLIVFITMASEPRFVGDALKVLGTGGIIGGAICGAVSGLFENARVAVAIGGVAGGVGGCVLAMIGTIWYTFTPWPSPQPYPAVEPVTDIGGGSWGVSRSQIYTVTISLDDMQHYYEAEMERHCVSGWQFETSTDCGEYHTCRQARCEIRRLWMEQYFRVTLYPVSESQIKVYQADMWQD